MRTMGIDLGEKRIGIAISDPQGIIAVPHSVIQVTGDKKVNIGNVVEIILELKVEQVVVGLPLNLQGEIQRAGEIAHKYVDTLKMELKKIESDNILVALHDERFSSFEAEKLFKARGLSSKKSRKKVDMLAASIILQSWLDVQQKAGAQNPSHHSTPQSGVSKAE